MDIRAAMLCLCQNSVQTLQDIMLWTWRTATDVDHQTDSDVGRAVQHILRHLLQRIFRTPRRATRR